MLSVSTSREERSYHHGDLRGALLRAASEVLAEQGEAAISLREVARRAGVSHNAPYRHFSDREALLAALAELGFDELLGCMRGAAQGLEPRDGLAALGRCYVGFALQRRGLFRLMFSGALGAAGGGGGRGGRGGVGGGRGGGAERGAGLAGLAGGGGRGGGGGPGRRGRGRGRGRGPRRQAAGLAMPSAAWPSCCWRGR